MLPLRQVSPDANFSNTCRVIQLSISPLERVCFLTSRPFVLIHRLISEFPVSMVLLFRCVLPRMPVFLVSKLSRVRNIVQFSWSFPKSSNLTTSLNGIGHQRWIWGHEPLVLWMRSVRPSDPTTQTKLGVAGQKRLGSSLPPVHHDA